MKQIIKIYYYLDGECVISVYAWGISVYAWGISVYAFGFS